jgi:hypothetical protein
MWRGSAQVGKIFVRYLLLDEPNFVEGILYRSAILEESRFSRTTINDLCYREPYKRNSLHVTGKNRQTYYECTRVRPSSTRSQHASNMRTKHKMIVAHKSNQYELLSRSFKLVCCFIRVRIFGNDFDLTFFAWFC